LKFQKFDLCRLCRRLAAKPLPITSFWTRAYFKYLTTAMQWYKNIADGRYHYGGNASEKLVSRIGTFRTILSIFSNTPPYKLPEGFEQSKNATANHCSPSRLQLNGMLFVYKFLKLRSGGDKNRFWTLKFRPTSSNFKIFFKSSPMRVLNR
jgi:hypothetical protein